MPLYEYRCPECGAIAERLLTMLEAEEHDERCPLCSDYANEYPVLMERQLGSASARMGKRFRKLTGWRQGIWQGGTSK